MCGRTACTLCPDDISKACTYKDKTTGKYRQPTWNHKSDSKSLQYIPSTNLAPTDVLPVILSGRHVNSDDDRIVQPMVWGMIPPWHKGDRKSHGLTTHNCRLEGLMGSKLYSGPFAKGCRCVVVCDGFYEWQTTKPKGNRQPYFIYMPQPDGMKIEDPSTWPNTWSETDGWKGPRLVSMAGLFDTWKSPEGEIIYSCTVITVETNEVLSWLHNRMPAILDTEEKISMWLHAEKLNFKQGFSLLKPVKLIQWHPVSTIVNNSRNKDVQCNKPLSQSETKPPTSSSSFMSAWLKKGVAATKRTTDKIKQEIDEPEDIKEVKKLKTEF